MKRIFIALPLPQPIRHILHAMGRSVQGARAVPEEQIHLTLRFVGDVDGTTFLDIEEKLHTLSGKNFPLLIRGVGHFPPRGKPRIIWAGVESSDELLRLKRKVDNQLIECGIPADSRKYSPHITLARLKTTTSKRVTEFLAGNSFLQFDQLLIEEFHLYSSHLSHKGAVHTLERSYSLGS